MKNFRKVLALVLVVATLFSFTAMASAKKLSDYTDADSVNYGPAVDILSTLGILNGYEDDSFKPTNTITREEMAKMIAVLANSGSDVSTLYATACTFADVAKDHWSASYVAYCAKTGIVAGRSATTFDPKGKVTGLETAKMLLVTMGFNAEKQGYVGSDWKVNVLRDAKNCGLLGNFAASYDVDAAITREEAAQMMLNALNANVIIGYVSNNVVTITNTAYSHKLKNGTLIDASSLSAKDLALYGNAIVAKDTLAEALYGAAFSKQAAHDCFGRPGFYWSFKNSKNLEAAGEVFFAEAVDYTSTTAVDFQTVLKNEKASSITYKTDVYVDSKLTSYASLTAAWDALKTLAGKTGKGVQTEIYINDADAQITIVIINTYIGVVKYTTNKAGKFYVDHNGTTLSASNKAYGFDEGDVILYWVCDTHTVHSAELAEPVTGLVTRAEANKANAATATVVHGGKTYEYAYNFGNYADDLKNKIPMNQAQVEASKAGQQYDLYLDKYGYIMGWTETYVGTDYTYAYVVEASGSYDKGVLAGDGKTYLYKAYRDMVYFDGSNKEDVAVNQKLWNLTDARYNNGTEFGSLVRYYVSSDVACMSGEADRAVLAGAGATLSGKGVITDGAATIYGTSSTKYMIRTWDYTKEEYVYNVYTKAELEGTYHTASDIVTNWGSKTNLQYFYTTSEAGVKYATYVFVDAAYIAVAQRAFVLNYIGSVSDSKFVNTIGAYDAYEAVVNGEAAVLAVTKGDTVLKKAADAAENADTFIGNLYTVNLQCIGLDDNGTPVYANVGVVKVATEHVLHVYKDNLEFDGKAVTIAEDAFAVIAFAGGYDFDGDGVRNEYTVINDVLGDFNQFYDTMKAVEDNPGEAWEANGAAWVITNGAGDVIEIYYQVK